MSFGDSSSGGVYAWVCGAAWRCTLHAWQCAGATGKVKEEKRRGGRGEEKKKTTKGEVNTRKCETTETRRRKRKKAGQGDDECPPRARARTRRELCCGVTWCEESSYGSTGRLNSLNRIRATAGVHACVYICVRARVCASWLPHEGIVVDVVHARLGRAGESPRPRRRIDLPPENFGSGSLSTADVITGEYFSFPYSLSWFFLSPAISVTAGLFVFRVLLRKQGFYSLEKHRKSEIFTYRTLLKFCFFNFLFDKNILLYIKKKLCWFVT